ncbi:hypothetical protein CDL12_16929 [Handroanthus impetiginosus]|uniref:Uncharacterized protein n=1 Tax=Handroanthus impetiginosus TaxID=429701 RepID=A0A2G9GYX6_9LAMI|nr:hypothetical protein CDL12_16929 [Handroanthus impetiginosus]
MSETMGGSDPPSPLSMTSETSKSSGNTGFDANRIAEVKAWLVSQFDAAGKDVPDFEYTPRSIAHLHNIATLSQAKTQAATIVANDFRQKAAEYRSQGLASLFSFSHLPLGLFAKIMTRKVISLVVLEPFYCGDTQVQLLLGLSVLHLKLTLYIWRFRKGLTDRAAWPFPVPTSHARS